MSYCWSPREKVVRLVETVTIVQVKKYDCFDQGKSNSYSKEEVQFGYILKGQPIRYLDKLDLECEKDYQQ